MSTETTTATEAQIRRKAIDALASDATKLGIDSHGSYHYFSRIENAVVVIRSDGFLEHREELADRPLDHWVNYVAGERPWRRCYFIDDYGDWLEEMLAPFFGAADEDDASE